MLLRQGEVVEPRSLNVLVLSLLELDQTLRHLLQVNLFRSHQALIVRNMARLANSKSFESS